MNISKTSFAMGAIAALVLGTGSAYAATGGNLVIGRSNAASTTTTLSNPNGTALTLNSKAGQPSLRVNRNVRVPWLNADMIDNLDSTRLALTTGQTGTMEAGGEWVDFDEDGTGDFIEAIAVCPPGTKLTGGGGADYTSSGIIIDNGPLGGPAWYVASTGADPADDAADVIAYAQCYNPRGAVPGASFRRSAEGQAEEVEPKVAAERRSARVAAKVAGR